MTEQKSTPRTWWHRLLGALLKELLTPLGITVQPDFPVMSSSNINVGVSFFGFQ